MSFPSRGEGPNCFKTRAEVSTEFKEWQNLMEGWLQMHACAFAKWMACKMLSLGCRMLPKWAPRWSKRTSRWTKMMPRWVQDCCLLLSPFAQMGQDGHKMTSRWPKMMARWIQDYFLRLSNLAQMGPWMAQGCCKMASRSLSGSDPSGRVFLGVPAWCLLIFFDGADDDAGDGDV